MLKVEKYYNTYKVKDRCFKNKHNR